MLFKRNCCIYWLDQPLCLGLERAVIEVETHSLGLFVGGNLAQDIEMTGNVANLVGVSRQELTLHETVDRRIEVLLRSVCFVVLVHGLLDDLGDVTGLLFPGVEGDGQRVDLSRKVLGLDLGQGERLPQRLVDAHLSSPLGHVLQHLDPVLPQLVRESHVGAVQTNSVHEVAVEMGAHQHEFEAVLEMVLDVVLHDVLVGPKSVVDGRARVSVQVLPPGIGLSAQVGDAGLASQVHGEGMHGVGGRDLGGHQGQKAGGQNQSKHLRRRRLLDDCRRPPQNKKGSLSLEFTKKVYKPSYLFR